MELIYNKDTFDYTIVAEALLQKRRRGNQGRRSDRKYKDLFCAFDIETTNDYSIDQSWMYIWQFQIEDYTIIGHYWDEYLEFLEELQHYLKEDEYLMIYVHNLSFEFSFLKGIYQFSNDEVFATDLRKVLKCEMFEHFEFRCSYYLTNMSLSQFTSKMGVEEKLSGKEFNYRVIRYPWTELTERELLYCIVDVRSLVAALKVFFAIEHDTFYTIPLTSTGFVRRDVKRAMRHFNKQNLQDMLPDYEIFTIMREAFRGGNTHANRYYANMIIENVSSYDRVSSYPDVQINELFPMSPWIREDPNDVDRLLKKIYKHKRAALMRVVFVNLRLKDPMFGCPYIPKHKCRNLTKHYNDNGRILWADYLEISLTDIDLKIILNEYDYDSIRFIDFYHCRYGRLPKVMRDVVKKYYQDKTQLKNVEGQEVYYMMSKAKLNSIYGMCVQSPVKQSIDFVDGLFKERFDNEVELLEAANHKAFLCYAWGIWTTARAREQLEIAIKLVGNKFVYCDTDSVKFIDDGTVSFDAYNRMRRTESLNNGGYAVDRDGHRYYLGLYDNEGTYKQFITMGAKKYAFVDQNDKLHITVAGVSKSKGAAELGSIENFKEGFLFVKAGGTASIYNDFPAVDHKIVDGHRIDITSNVVIKDSTYTLGITGEYRKILSNPVIWLDLFK